MGTLVLALPLGRVPTWKVGPKLARGKISRFLCGTAEGKMIAAHELIQAFDENETPYQHKLYRLRGSAVLITLQAALLLALALRVGALA
jgi:hypothetical protein